MPLPSTTCSLHPQPYWPARPKSPAAKELLAYFAVASKFLAQHSLRSCTTSQSSQCHALRYRASCRRVLLILNSKM
eukprot:3250902-Amphidinium_carterae.1